MTDESTQILPRPPDEGEDVLEVPVLPGAGLGPLGDEPMEEMGGVLGGEISWGRGKQSWIHRNASAWCLRM